MTDTLNYKSHLGSVRHSPEDGVFHGKIESILDLVLYEAPDLEGLRKAFEEAVEDYLELQPPASV